MHINSRLLLACCLWVAAVAGGSSQGTLSPSALRDHPSINYWRSEPTDAVARLNIALRSEHARLEFDPATGYLRSVLDALGVPIESQVLVFSKTSFQAPRINPQNPRAIYFNEAVSVGWVRGGEVLEVLAQDPRQGAVFYTLDQTPTSVPQLRRNAACIQCHTSDATLNVPGMFMGSVFPAPDGTARYGPAYLTDHRTPIDVRWGGWYVTGQHRADRHMGNAVFPDTRDFLEMVTPETVHVDSLEGRFDMTGYLSHSSDIAALLVLDHQARMFNLITRVGWEARLGADAGRPLQAAVEELVDYLLFVDEATLPGPIAGTSTFATTFPVAGPRDHFGRSLRDLALGDRLMRYPCSYMVYSEPFEALPAPAKSAVYARMWQILSGAERLPRYERLTASDRLAIVQILRDTKNDLPTYFHDSSSQR